MTKLKAVVIGTGSMGSRHARIYTELPGTELVAVADAVEENSVRVAEQYNSKAYTDYENMLEKEQPDLVSVTVPTVFHMEVAKTALVAGCHVLVEKPIAASIEEAEILITTAATANRKLMVGHVVRFEPVIQALRQHIEAGELGHIYQVVCRRIGPFPGRIQDVGVVLDLTPHDLDVMRYITKEDPLCVYAETAQRIHAEYEDLLTALLRFPSGLVGMLEINWLTPTKVREVSVLGERGMFRADSVRQELTFYNNAEVHTEMWNTQKKLKSVSEGRMIRFPLQHHEPLKAELDAFVASVQNDTPVPVTGTDGLTALRLALALLTSGAERRLVQV
jgi:predicted dehydrogenase